MQRRTYLKSMLAIAGAAAAGKAAPAHPIQLHCDLEIDPSKEKLMLHNYETIFRPAAIKQDGYIDLKLIKLRSVMQGKAPVGLTYRFVLTFESEEKRQVWIHSATHQKVWPTIEDLLTNKKDYTCLLFDVA